VKGTILALAFALTTLPGGFAQTQSSSSTTEKTKHETQTQYNPDGTAVHHSQTTHDKTDTNTNPDGSATTVHQQDRNTHTNVKTDTPAGRQTTEHKSSSSSTTTTTSPR
jgi:hypothetical protein